MAPKKRQARAPVAQPAVRPRRAHRPSARARASMEGPLGAVPAEVAVGPLPPAPQPDVSPALSWASVLERLDELEQWRSGAGPWGPLAAVPAALGAAPATAQAGQVAPIGRMAHSGQAAQSGQLAFPGPTALGPPWMSSTPYGAGEVTTHTPYPTFPPFTGWAVPPTGMGSGTSFRGSLAGTCGQVWSPPGPSAGAPAPGVAPPLAPGVAGAPGVPGEGGWTPPAPAIMPPLSLLAYPQGLGVLGAGTGTVWDPFASIKAGAIPCGLPATPLGYHLHPSVKEAIWRGEYVDLFSLLNREVPKQDKEVVTGEKAKKPKVTKCFSSWLYAFLTYAAVVIQRQPAMAAAFLKYIDLIARAHFEYKGTIWRHYDKGFRMRVAVEPNLPWDTVVPDLWFRATHMSGKEGCERTDSGHFMEEEPGVAAPSKGTPSVAGKGASPTCHEFAAKGACFRPFCRYKHACGNCGGPHGASVCPRPKKGAERKGGPGKPPAAAGGKGAQPN